MPLHGLTHLLLDKAQVISHRELRCVSPEGKTSFTREITFPIKKVGGKHRARTPTNNEKRTRKKRSTKLINVLQIIAFGPYGPQAYAAPNKNPNTT